MLYAHIPLVARLPLAAAATAAAETPAAAPQPAAAVVAMLPCSSAQLGQLFGLLRVSAMGLAACEFGASDPLVELLAQLAGDGTRTF
eukprot:7344464-Prymnesium_polylepis.1